MVEDDSDRLDRVFQALADPTRRQMLHRLTEGECSISELARPHQMSFAGASKHVKALESAGLVQRRISGRTHLCRLSPEPLADAHDWLRYYKRFWNSRLGAFELLFQPQGAERS